MTSSSALHSFLTSHGCSLAASDWCQEQGLETVADLRCVPRSVLPQLPSLLAAWEGAQGVTPTGVGEVLEIQALAPAAHAPPAKRTRTSTSSATQSSLLTPRTVSADEVRRRQAAAQAVALSWSWLPLHFGLGLSIPDRMCDRRRAMVERRIVQFEARCVWGALAAWRDFIAWFEAHAVAMPQLGWPSIFIEDFIEAQALARGPSVALAMFHRLAWLHKHLRAPLQFEGWPNLYRLRA